MKCGGPIYDRFVGPLLLAALNIAPQQGSAKLAGAVVRETLALVAKLADRCWRMRARQCIRRARDYASARTGRADLI
jgi:hypothetical protein